MSTASFFVPALRSQCPGFVSRLVVSVSQNTTPSFLFHLKEKHKIIITSSYTLKFELNCGTHMSSKKLEVLFHRFKQHSVSVIYSPQNRNWLCPIVNTEQFCSYVLFSSCGLQSCVP